MSEMQSAGRYEGRPLLRLLECYVLQAIDELSVADRQTLVAMAPQLGPIYGQSGTWEEIIEKVMELPPTIPEKIREMWLRNQAIAQDRNLELTPQKFAEMFVDQNLGGQAR